MKGFHTLRFRREDSSLDDFELLVMLLSALKWREKNGMIRLVTDSRGKEFVKDCGIISAWNDVSTCLDEMDNLGWNENSFWAGAKLFALSNQSAPCVMIDLDFILWQHIDFSRYGTNIATIHREQVNNGIYPGKEHFCFYDGFKLPLSLDWEVEACNTAFAYFGGQEIIRRYTSFAFDFMTHANTEGEYLTYMVFVEQRWLSMCAKIMGREIFSFSSLGDLFRGKQQYFTHIWGDKERLRRSKIYREAFCRKCAIRILRDFPDWGELLQNTEWAAQYFLKEQENGDKHAGIHKTALP